MAAPLVSIVMPSFNQARFIRAAIESVLAQDYPGLELLIIDGGSTDGTAAIVAEYGSRVFWTSARDRGQADAVNRGFRRARGEILGWLNSDDVLEPGAVSAVVPIFEASPEAAAVYGDGQMIDAGGEVVSPIRTPAELDLFELVHVQDTLLQSSVFLRRSAYETVGPLDETLHWTMDYDLFIRLALRYPFVHIPRVLSSWRRYPETKTLSGGRRRFREFVRVLRRYSNRRYPPGYWRYAFDWVRKSCREWQRHAAGTAWEAPASRLLSLAEQRFQATVRHLRRRSGRYADGWAAPRVEILLRGRTRPGKVVIRGRLPEHCPVSGGQRLVVECDGAARARIDLAPGSFEVAVSLAARAQPWHLTIRAAKSFVPRREGIDDDGRRLAYRLDAVVWEEECPPALRDAR